MFSVETDDEYFYDDVYLELAVYWGPVDKMFYFIFANLGIRKKKYFFLT